MISPKLKELMLVVYVLFTSVNEKIHMYMLLYKHLSIVDNINRHDGNDNRTILSSESQTLGSPFFEAIYVSLNPSNTKSG